MHLQISRPVLYGFIALAALGFIDALYLTALHYLHAIPPCYVGSCEQVLSSSYSILFGVPVALLGVMYYFFVLFCATLYAQAHNLYALTLALLATFVGLLYSIYAFVLQAWVIHAYCQYCLLSGAISLFLFAISVYVYFVSRRAASIF